MSELLSCEANVTAAEKYLDLGTKFKIIAEETAALIAIGGVRVKAYRSGLPYFSALSIEKQLSVLKNLEFYRDLCSEQNKEGYEIKDSHSFTWRALNKLGLIPPSDLFSHLSAEDIVEIYSDGHVQLFRNFRYFEFCSFSLEELYSREWYHLYHRDESVVPFLNKTVEILQSPECRHTFKPDIPTHTVKEVESDENIVMDYTLKWVAPLISHKKFAGFISIEEARIHTVRDNN